MIKVQIFFFLLIIQFAAAQEVKNVSLSVDSATFTQVVQILEKQTDYRFFYKTEWVDSLHFTISEHKKPLETVLDNLFKNTHLYYFIIDKQVFITNNVMIISDLRIAELLENQNNIHDSVEKGLVFSREYKSEDKFLNEENKIIELGKRSKLVTGGYATIAGYVKEYGSGEPVSGVLIFIEKPSITSTTNENGFYSIKMPVGKHKLKFRLIGMKPIERNVVLFSDGQLNIDMSADVRSLREVIIASDRDKNIENVQMGITRIDVNETKNVPIILGERDVMKIATTFAGIKTVGEGAAGYNVRGGKSDQNLIMLDGIPIYNTSHFLGFFSVFNSEAIDDMEIFKGSIPAEYGGRLSSVMDISAKQANRKNITGVGGISPVASNLKLEIPTIKGKGGIMIGGRTTYSNWVIKKVKNADFNKNRVSFSDIILKADYDINANNKLNLSSYYSADNFRMRSDTLFSITDFRYKNIGLSLRYLRNFSDYLSTSLTMIYSGYKYKLSYDASPANAFFQNFDISESIIKGELKYSKPKFHDVSSGIELKKIQSNPGVRSPLGEASLIEKQENEPEQSFELSLFLSDEYNITKSLSLYAGIRYSLFGNFGPQTVYSYIADLPKTIESKMDPIYYARGERIKSYSGFEPRISARIRLNDVSSIKVGYSRTQQYIHTLTNSASVSPTDIWKLSSTYLRPQVADQYSLGYFLNSSNSLIEMSLESYYKKIQNLLDFKAGASFLLNPIVETVILQGPGKSYGLELSVKKSGRLNGWINYTYSRTFIKLDSKHAVERINGGAYYPANYDMPHAINLVLNFKQTHRLSYSYNFTYKSGRPITYPEGVYNFHGSPSLHYSNRNAYRIPNYIRMDIGLNLEAGHKLGRLGYSYWSLSIYNVLGTDNPYSVFFNVEGNKIKGYKLVIFGKAIPTLTYNFKF